MKRFNQLLLTTLLCLNSLFSVAQQGDTLSIQRNEKGNITFARFKPDVKRRIEGGENFLKSALHTKQGDDFRLIKEITDALGISHQRYQQYYKGIKVENAEYLIHGKNGIIETINGDYQEVNIMSVAPSITEQQAINEALNYVNAQKYKWQDPGMERFIKQNTNNPNATYYPKGEIVITRDLLKGGKSLRLAWKFTISSLNPNNEQWIYVDAVTSEVIAETRLIYDANTPSTAETRYSGTLGITSDSFTGGFRLRENRNAVDIQTLNLQGTSNYANAIDFSNTNTDWTTGNWPNITQDQQALDAHWGAENVLDYWRVVHNRNSLDGTGIRVLSYVHYLTNWNNAQWVGGTNNHFMQYGDGDGLLFNPLTALDICAHEMGHGITEFTAGLSPGTQESGALNEGFSDIWGACVEHWAAPNKQTWRMGEEVFGTTAFDCIRDLQNPKSNTAYEGQHPNTYHGQFWDNNGEPHNNSTVLSHWFYLLSQGGNGTNDIGHTYSVTAIGMNDAQLIAFRAESLYLTSSATYIDASNMTTQAARDLFGNCSSQVASAMDAWYAVGIGNPFVSPMTPSITAIQTSGPGEPTTVRFTATPLVAGAIYNWYVDNALKQNTSSNSFDWYFPCRVTKTINCSMAGTCSTSGLSNSISPTGECIRTHELTLSPNPATNTVTISSNIDSSEEGNASIYEARIYDDQGNLKLQQNFNGAKKVTLNVSGLINGTYFVEITNDSYTSQQFVIRRLLLKK